DCTRSFYVVEEQMPFVQPIGSHELNWAKPVLFVLRNSDRGCHGDLRTHKGLPFLELTAPPRPIPLPRDIHEVVCAVTSGSMSTSRVSLQNRIAGLKRDVPPFLPLQGMRLA